MLYLKASEYGIRDLYFQAQHGISVLGRQFVIDEWLPNNSTELAKRKCRQYLESNIVCILVEFSDRFGIYLDLDDNIDVSVSCEKVSLDLDARENSLESARPVRNLPSTTSLPRRVPPAPKTAPPAPRRLQKNNSSKNKSSSRSNSRKTGNFAETPTRVEKVSRKNVSKTALTFEQLSELVEKLAANMDIQSEQQFRHLLSQKLILDRRLALQILKQSFGQCVGPIAGLIYQDAMDDLGKIETFEEVWQFFERLAMEIDEPDYQQQFRNRLSDKLIPDSQLALKIVRDSLQASVGPIAEMIYQDVINS